MASSQAQGSAPNVPTEAAAGTGWQGSEANNPYRESFLIDNQEVIGSSVASVDLTNQIPAGGVVDFVMVQCVSAAGITTGTHLGVGTGSDVDEFFEETFTGIDAVNNQKGSAVANIYFASDTTAKLFSTNGSGAAAGTLDSGTYRVQISGYIPRAIADV